MRFKYSITLSSFRNKEERFEKVLETLVSQGYDAVEIFGEPSKVDLKVLTQTLRSFNISVCGVTGIWGSASEESSRRRLLSLNSSTVAYSENYVKKCIKMCDLLGGYETNLCLFADEEFFAFDRNHGEVQTDLKERLIRTRAIPTLSKLSRYAEDHDIHLLLEPLNRYNTPCCTTLRDAVYIATKLNRDNFGILLDTFHMNIEEDSIENAILKSRSLLRHIHFSDNNRKMPGCAHIDFQSIVRSLIHINYHQYISFEPILPDKNYFRITKSGLDLVKGIEKKLDRTSLRYYGSDM